MKTLIFSIEKGGDIVAFQSIESAEQYMEPQDVASGIYEVFDSNGELLQPYIEIEDGKFLGIWKIRVEKTKLRLTGKKYESALAEHLRSFLIRVNSDTLNLPSRGDGELKYLIEKALPYVRTNQ